MSERRLTWSSGERGGGHEGAEEGADHRDLAAALLNEGDNASKEGRSANVTKRQLTAFGQANLAFVSRVLELCAQHQARVFAAIVDREAPRPQGKGFLRKDYSYLFERFYYFLEEQSGLPQGLLIFDELEKSRSRILLDQIGRYFQHTAKGRIRSSRILPEPLFGGRTERCGNRERAV